MSFFLDNYGNTTRNGIFGVVGDSNADGRSTTVPTVGAGILYNFVSGSFSAITTQSVANDTSTPWGSIWQQFAIDYNAATGLPVYLVNGASGGSNFYPDGDTNNWYSSGGTLYAAFTSKMSSALTARGAVKPEGIFVNLGINDARSISSAAEGYGNFQTGVTSLFTRLTTDYPGVPIYVIIPGRAETPTYSYNDSNFYGVRATIRATGQTFTDVNIVAGALTWVDETTVGTGNAYMADGLHYGQPMNNQLGTICARFVNSTISNKWARAVVCSRWSDYTGSFATTLATRITNLVTSGDYFKMEPTVLTVSPSQDERDCLIDITFLSNCVLFGAPTVNADHCLAFNGTSQYMSAIYIVSWFNQSGAGQDNYIVGARLVSRTTASGTAASLVGRAVGTIQTRVIQTIVPSVAWYPSRNTAETWSGGDTSLQNAFYGVARNSGTGYLYKDSTQVDSAVSASAGALNATMITMAHEPGTGITQYLGGTLGYHLNAAFNIDLSYTLTQLEAIIAAR